MIVVDASVVVAALIESTDTGAWAASLLASEQLAAPAHLPVEVAATLRRGEVHGALTPDAAYVAHRLLAELSVELHRYEAVAERAWQLRHTLTMYDAAYVALAEDTATPLATLDVRIVRAPGPRCEFLTPPAGA